MGSKVVGIYHSAVICKLKGSSEPRMLCAAVGSYLHGYVLNIIDTRHAGFSSFEACKELRIYGNSQYVLHVEQEAYLFQFFLFGFFFRNVEIRANKSGQVIL